MALTSNDGKHHKRREIHGETRRIMSLLLSTIRRVRNISVAEAARAGGIAHKNWMRYESGSTSIPADVLFRFAMHFSIPIDALFPTQAFAASAAENDDDDETADDDSISAAA